MKSILVGLFICTSLAAHGAHANNQDDGEQPLLAVPNNIHQGTFALGIGWGRFTFTDVASAAAGLDNVNSGYEIYTSYDPSPFFRFELIYNRALVNDQNSFSTISVGDNGFIEYVDSETKARIWLASLSLKNTVRDGLIEYSLGGGYAGLDIKREIDNCNSCGIDELQLDGGSFLFGGIDMRTGNTSRLGLTFRRFLSGDLHDTLLIRWKYLTRK